MFNVNRFIAYCQEFDRARGLAHRPGLESTVFSALAMVGEAGEVANLVKKVWRDGPSDEIKQTLGIEILDTLYYLIRLTEAAGLDMEKAFQLFREKVEGRFPLPE